MQTYEKDINAWANEQARWEKTLKP